MRVLLTTRGSSGHVTPLAPFGHACLRAGHEVLVAAQEHFEENVARTGLPFAPVGAPRPEDWMPLLPGVRRGSGSTRGTTGWSPSSSATIDVRAMLPGLRQVADEWRPDLIVRESWEYGSTIVAEERGIPLARVGLGIAGVEDVSERAAVPAVDRGARRGRASPPIPTASGCGRRPTSPTCRRRSRTRPSRRRRGRCASARPRCRSPPRPTASRSSTSASARSPPARTCRSTPRSTARRSRRSRRCRRGSCSPSARTATTPSSARCRPTSRSSAGSRRTRCCSTPPPSSPTAATARRSARSPTACRSSCCRCSRSTSGSTPPRSPARAPASRSTASATPAARSTCRTRRRSPRCGRRSSTCSPTRARARARGGVAEAMRALPPVDDAAAALAATRSG